MEAHFFIGRANELQKLENFTLRQVGNVHRPRLAHVWGPKGNGKSSLVNRFVSILAEESAPILYCHVPESDSGPIEDYQFYQQLVASIGTNIGDFQPWLEQLKNTVYTSTESFESTLYNFWGQQFTKLVETISQESSIDIRDLSIVIAIDDIDLLPLNQRIGFCSFVNYLCENASPSLKISVITTGAESLALVPDIEAFWETSIQESFQIQLGNLARDEVTQLLESHDLDANLISKIYIQTEGNPGKIMAMLEDQDLESMNFEESYNRGKNMMYQFNNFQRRWIEWAAIVKHCNEEIISMITEGTEIQECMNWIRNNYPTHFFREGEDYVLKPDTRRSILAFVKRDQPDVFNEVSEIVKKLAGVKHSVPNVQHRILLSKLADLNYFDFDLLKKIFDDDTYKALLNLIEGKPIFFRQELFSYRLASNIRAAMSVYNTLRKNPEREKFKYRVQNIWEEKQKHINEDLGKTEKELHDIEERNRSLSQSVSKIQDEIKKLKRTSSKRVASVTPINTVQRPKRLSVFGAFLLQATGIAILYVDTLITKDMSMSYLLLAVICIASGIILGLKGPSTPVAVTSSGSANNAKNENYDKVIQNLEIDLLNLINQKDQALAKIEKNKQTIANLQTLRTHTYLPDSDV